MARYRIVSKRRLLIWIILLLVSGALFIPFLDQYTNNYLVYLDELAKTDPGMALEKNLAMLQLVFNIMAVVLCFLGLYFVCCGKKSILTGSYPPSGSWIIEGQKTLSGQQAKRAGRLQWLTGYLLIVAAIIMLIFIRLLLTEILGVL